MRVLHVINSLAGGGAERLVSIIIPILREKGIETDVVVLTKRNAVFESDLRNKGVSPIYLSQNANIYSPFHIYKLFKFLTGYDIIHTHLFPVQYFVALAKLLSNSKVKLVTSEHSTENSRMNNRFFYWIEKLIYSQYSKIVSISNETNVNLSTWLGHSKSKFCIVGNGINVKAFETAKGYLKTEIDNTIKQEDRLIIKVARFDNAKDHATVLKALSLLPASYKLLLVGTGPLINENKLLAKALNVFNRVFFLGFRKDVAELIKSADISVLSSHWEGFGLVAVESMAAGVPLVASNVEGLNSVVNNAGILFEKGDAYDLANKIIEITESPTLSDQIILRQNRRVRKYDIRTTAQEYITIYNSLI